MYVLTIAFKLIFSTKPTISTQRKHQNKTNNALWYSFLWEYVSMCMRICVCMKSYSKSTNTNVCNAHMRSCRFEMNVIRPSSTGLPNFGLMKNCWKKKILQIFETLGIEKTICNQILLTIQSFICRF